MGYAKDYQSGNKVIYFVPLPMILCKASDDVLRYKLIYFVLQRIMFCFHQLEACFLMSGNITSDEWKHRF